MTFSFRICSRLCAAALVGGLSATAASAAPTVAITGPSSVVPGGTIQLDVTASGFTDLYAYQFDVAFNPTLFAATGATEGPFLATAGSTFFDGGAIDNAAGILSFVLGSLIGPGGGANGAGELAHLSFDAGALGSSSGSFTLVNFIALGSALNPIDVVLQGFAVSVPEPSALALLLMAIGAGVVVGTASRRAGRAVGDVTAGA